MSLIDFFRRSKVTSVPKENAAKQMGVTIATSVLMDSAIDLWSRMYENNPPWKGGEEEVIPLNLPAAISEEMARLALTEFSLECTGSPRADYVYKQIKRSFKRISDHMERFCAKGGIAMKPYVSGDSIKVDFTQADRFFPTAFNSNHEITGAVFVDSKRIGDYVYTRLEHHDLVGTTYTVTNKAFRSEKLNSVVSDDSAINVEYPFQTQVPLSEVDDWASLSETPVVIQNIERPLFVYVAFPRANTIDTSSPLGPSVFSRAIDIIEETDRQFSKIRWEYKAKEAAVHASEDMFDTDKKGNPILPAGHERLYRTMDAQTIDGQNSFFQIYAPEIRDNSLFNGLNKYFQRIEFLCGLSYGTISDPQQIEKTAEEIRMSKQRSYTVVCRVQDTWTDAIEELVYAMDVLCTLYHLAPAGKIEPTITWGDGVMEDTDKEYNRRWAQVMAGKLRPEAFLAWYYGCTEEEALKMMPAVPEEEEFPEEE